MNSRIARGRALGVALVMVMLAALLMALSGQNPAQTGLSEEALPSKHATRHSPQTFEDDGDIWMVRNKKMHLVNLTPDTAVFNDLDPAVSPDAGRIAFASDRDGDFEIYLANISTGLVQRVTDNAVDDRSPVWSPDGQWISYHSPHYSSPTHSGIFLGESRRHCRSLDIVPPGCSGGKLTQQRLNTGQKIAFTGSREFR